MWEINLHKECKKDNLAEYGFRKCGAEYRLNIPLYKYKHTPVISVNFVVSIFDNYIGYDVNYILIYIIECIRIQNIIKF